MKTFLVGCAWLCTLPGCLSNNYQVSRAELLRLAQSPQAVRGERVRVLQQTAFGADDVASEDIDEDARPSSRTSVSVNVSSAREGGSHGGSHGGFGHGRSGSVGWGARHGGAVHGGSGRSGSTSGSGHGGGASSGGGGNGADAIVLAIVAVAIANGVGVALAAVEGRRFDGCARVHSDEWLVLVTPRGSQWLPLSALTERDAAAADHAVIVDRDKSVLRLGRAPLDRKGFAYEVELGTAVLNTVTGTRDFGFASRTGVGYFPTQTLGFLFADQVAFGESHDAPRGGAIFNGRVAGELEYLPVQVGRLHAGFYTELGGALVIQDLPDRTHRWSGPYAAAGCLAQIDWTTRLALNLRGGIAALPAHPASTFLERSYVPELTLGISVY